MFDVDGNKTRSDLQHDLMKPGCILHVAINSYYPKIVNDMS